MCEAYPSPGDTAWLVMSGGLVFIMTPGLGFFYGGMARSKHFLSTVMTSMLAIAIVSMQWFFWGYTLVFSVNGTSFIGDMSHFVLQDVGLDPHPNAPCVPALTFMFYQLMFAIITPALAFGAAAERASLGAYMVFLVVWSTLVYDFVAYWTWNPNGWLFKLGGLDFAGGGPVHLASGTAALAYAIVLGKREGLEKEHSRPHNISHVVLGTALLWFGWFGFNGGSELFSNARTANACIVSHMASGVAGLTWVLLDYFFGAKKLTTMGFCTGCVTGLVVITPAAGYVTVAGSIAVGAIGTCVCFSASFLKNKWPIDDALEVFAIHGIGGLTGALLTGIFATDYVNTLDASAPQSGWLDRHWVQLGIQMSGVLSIGTWSFCMSLIILKIMDRIPWLGLRLPPDLELIGSDESILGEVAYRHENYFAHSRASRLFLLKEGSAGLLKALGVTPSKRNSVSVSTTPVKVNPDGEAIPQSDESQREDKKQVVTTAVVVRREADLEEEPVDDDKDNPPTTTPSADENARAPFYRKGAASSSQETVHEPENEQVTPKDVETGSGTSVPGSSEHRESSPTEEPKKEKEEDRACAQIIPRTSCLIM